MSLYKHGPQLEDAFLTRRQVLRKCGMGMGALALADLMAQAGLVQASPAVTTGAPINPLTPKQPQFPATAKRVIHIFANGGPSQVDTFDPKPMLLKYAGKELPNGNYKTERRTAGAFPSPCNFPPYGHRGFEVR